MLIFAAFVPSHPLLIPAIGGEHYSALSATTKALQILQGALRTSTPESIVLISYPKKMSNTYGMQFAQKVKGNLKDFGDFSTEVVFPCDYVLGHTLKQAVHAAFPVHVTGSSLIPYTATVPLLLLEIPSSCPVFLLEVSSQSLTGHAALGKALYAALMQDKKRIAVIATGDLSHAEHTKNSQATPHEEFDRNVVKLIQEHSNALLATQEQHMQTAHEAGLKSLAVLTGIAENVHTIPKVLSYERPLGVGHMVLQYPV